MTDASDKTEAQHCISPDEKEKIEKKITKLAKNARSEAIFSIFFAGWLVGPIALARISRAKRLIEKNGLCREKLASLSTTKTIAWVGIGVWILVLIFLFAR